MNDKLIRWVAILSVVIVAVVAATISYTHITELISAHGVGNWLRWLYPLAVDGLIMAGSMSMLDSAQHHEQTHWLARVAVFGGIAASLGANVLTGIDFGILGAIIAGWPAAALIMAYELLMFMIRASARRQAATTDVAAELTVASPDVPETVSVPVSALEEWEAELSDVPETVASPDSDDAQDELVPLADDDWDEDTDTDDDQDSDEETGSVVSRIVPELRDVPVVKSGKPVTVRVSDTPVPVRRGRSQRRPGATLRDDWGNTGHDFEVEPALSDR